MKLIRKVRLVFRERKSDKVCEVGLVELPGSAQLRLRLLTILAIATLSAPGLLWAQTTRTGDQGVKVTLPDVPRLEKFVEPALPPGMTEEPGSVQATLILRADGWVAEVQLVKVKDARLWMSTEAAARQWRFDPASLARLPQPVRVNVTVDYPRPPAHNAGKLILETDLFRVTAMAAPEQSCPNTQANVSITWRVGADEDLSGASAAFQKHLATIWDAIRKQCPQLAGIYLSNYVSGVRLLQNSGNEVAETAPISGDHEIPINSLMAFRDAAGKFQIRTMMDSPAYASLAAARAQRKTASPVALPSARPLSASISSSPTPAPRVPAASITAPAPAPMSPVPAPVAPAAPPASVLAPLDVRRLRYGDMMRTIYLGRFDLVPITDERELTLITAEGAIGRKLFTSYVEAFSSLCPASLSPRKIRIQKTTITHEQKVNGLGMVMSDTVVDSKTVDTNTFVEPEFAQAYVAIVNAADFEALPAIMRDLIAGRSDSFGGAGLNHLNDILVMWLEMREVIGRHGCESPQVKRMAANVLAYVKLQPPAPQNRYDGFTYYCASLVPRYVPGATRAACSCLKDTFRAAIDLDHYYALEDDFTEEHFMKSVLSRVGLQKKVGACIR